MVIKPENESATYSISRRPGTSLYNSYARRNVSLKVRNFTQDSKFWNIAYKFKRGIVSLSLLDSIIDEYELDVDHLQPGI
jgi:hypothetical protein